MKKEAKKADQGTVATESGDKKHYKWEELPFVSRNSLWNPAKQISAKGSISKDLIGEEFALAYLKLIKEEWPQVGLVSLFFIVRDMSKGMHLNGCSGIERAFFDMIDCILREYCIKMIPMDELRKRNREQLVSRLADWDFPKTWQLEVIKTMGRLNELLWNKKIATGKAA